MQFLFLNRASGLESRFWPITDSDYIQLRMDFDFYSLHKSVEVQDLPLWQFLLLNI